jgi:hypothetical protein
VDPARGVGKQPMCCHVDFLAGHLNAIQYFVLALPNFVLALPTQLARRKA